MRKVQLFDTTLRDGDQTPGVNFNIQEKVQIARQLERWGIDAIEAGFPVASPGDFEAVREIANSVEKMRVVGLARCQKKDIDRAYEALKGAKLPQIHVFIATSPVHMEYKLKMTPDEVLESIAEHVSYAKEKFELVQFSPEDATRTEPEFLRVAVQTAVDAGARIINIPDTVGYSNPNEYGAIFRKLKKEIVCDEEIIYSSHCHDDLGMATANALAAIENGASRVEGTVNGIGERAGNTALEEIALALYIRKDYYEVQTKIVLNETKKTSDLVSRLSGVAVPRNKAVVGSNAYAHESGIHQDGFLKNPNTYEIITPTLVGVSDSSLPLGKLSGRHAFKARLEKLGYIFTDEQIAKFFKSFKVLADKKREITDQDLIALIHGNQSENPEYTIEQLQLQYVSDGYQGAIATVNHGEVQVTDSAVGGGSIQAIYNTIDRIMKTHYKLTQYRIQAITGGEDAQAEVHVSIQNDDGQLMNGVGIDFDVLQSSAKAYLEAVANLKAMEENE